MLSIKPQGVREVRDRLDKTEKRLVDLREFHHNVTKPELLAAFDKVFEAQGIPRWKPLAPETIEQKRKGGYDLRILHRKGPLRRSYTEEGADNKIIINQLGLTFRNLLPYASYHEEGRGVPQRQVVEQVLRDKAFQRRISQKMSRYIKDGKY